MPSLDTPEMGIDTTQTEHSRRNDHREDGWCTSAESRETFTLARDR